MSGTVLDVENETINKSISALKMLRLLRETDIYTINYIIICTIMKYDLNVRGARR